ncbi:MAG TPA: hypothetical protein VEC96_13565 [Anaerolineae bacterium]|nr:hypothetical protein [Anaerolineae bacterium]
MFLFTGFTPPAVANPRHRQNQGGPAGVKFYLLPQTAHMDVDGALAVHIGLVNPNRVEDLGAAESLAGVLGQKSQQRNSVGVKFKACSPRRTWPWPQSITKSPAYSSSVPPADSSP